MAARKRVVIDTDVAIGIAERDVDDALAIVMAVNSQALDVCGITLTYGNDTLENVERCMSELSSVVGLSKVEMAAGASSSDDLDRRTGATFLFERVARDGAMTVLCLGPATNLATFVEGDKELASRD